MSVIEPESELSPDEVARPEQSLSSRLLAFFTGRWFTKLAFLAFFAFAVVRLLGFQRWARGEGPYVSRPESVAGLLPVGHFTSFFAWLRGGGWDSFLPAGLVIILAAIIVSTLFKRGFCGWVCPVGTLWELIALAGRKLLGKNLAVPRWLDLIGLSLRYVIAGLALLALASVSVQEAVAFRQLPYMWIADLKIVSLMASPTYLVMLGIAAVATFVLGPVWCRYLCPVGGLYSAFGVLSVCAVERDEDRCISCHRCGKVCHARVDPERVRRVAAPECDGCMDCVRVCPVENCLEARVARAVRIPAWSWPLLVAGTWLIIWGFAVALGSWKTSVPDEAFRQIINSGLIEEKTQGFVE